jgi:CRISPR-associated protein Cmr4
MNKRTFHLHALSAVHVGTGQGVGTVDLPIARAKASNLPLIPGSGIKGVLRDSLELDDAQAKTLFGPNNATDPAHAGALAVGDAHLLLLPIRSFAGTVAFATCPFILRQYARDLELTLDIPVVADDEAHLSNVSCLEIDQKIALEDLDMDSYSSDTTDQWAQQIAQAIYPTDPEWQTQLTKRFVVLPDNIFSFLADTATEIRMRIKIDRATRTVQQGALWSEENLPAESILWGIMGISPSRNHHDNDKRSADDLSAQLQAREFNIQLGGKHTVGRGLCRFILA